MKNCSAQLRASLKYFVGEQFEEQISFYDGLDLTDYPALALQQKFERFEQRFISAPKAVPRPIGQKSKELETEEVEEIDGNKSIPK